MNQTPAPAETQAPKLTAGAFTMNVLNGISIAVVVALVPQALLGEILKALLPVFPAGKDIIQLVTLTSSLLPAIIGIVVALQFKLTPIQTATIGVAGFLGSGVATPMEKGFHLVGTGLVINSGVTAAIAVALVLFIGNRLGSYTILLLPTVVVLIAGSIGALVTYPVVKVFTIWLGDLINSTTTLQPILMGAVLAVLFSILIVSPVSTVGIATAIFMEGISSGTANLGCVAAGFGLLIAGWKANGFAKSVLPVLGSPKVQMANMMSRPVSMMPFICSAAVLGAVGGAWGISGTPLSAGFGISGLMGPLAALNYEGWGWNFHNLSIVVLCFIVLPIVLNLAFSYLFTKLKWIQPEHYRLDFE